MDHLETDPVVARVEPSAQQGAERLAVDAFGLTDPGRVRETNEDHFLIAELTRAMWVQQSSLRQPGRQYSDDPGHLFIVADGIGGHQAGELASALALLTIEDFLLNTFTSLFPPPGPRGGDALTEFQAALVQADERIHDEAHRSADLRGMGTTVTMAYHVGARLFIEHVGDSRCYLMRGGQLRRLTCDHTLVEELVRRDVIRPEEAARHRWRHVIVNAVGGGERGVQVEAHQLDIEVGDVILLCSDGLTEMVPDGEISAMLLGSPGPRQACEQLVAEANGRGGRDNITAIVARFGPPASG